MNLCEYISEFKCAAGEAAYRYSVLKTFGNESKDQYYKLLAMNSMIRTLERQVTGTRKIKVKENMQGKTVSFSSLRSSNNLLYLDSKASTKCLTSEIRPCLTEEQICLIIEKLNLLCKT